jgi:glycosyltransferase involved in cell wall biosynthesis
VNIEALACGLPAIGSRVGGIPEIVADGVTGYLVPAGDYGLLADRVHRLLDDPVSRAAMGATARALTVDQYSPQRRLPDYLAWYWAGDSSAGEAATKG